MPPLINPKYGLTPYLKSYLSESTPISGICVYEYSASHLYPNRPQESNKSMIAQPSWTPRRPTEAKLHHNELDEVPC